MEFYDFLFTFLYTNPFPKMDLLKKKIISCNAQHIRII